MVFDECNETATDQGNSMFSKWRKATKNKRININAPVLVSYPQTSQEFSILYLKVHAIQ